MFQHTQIVLADLAIGPKIKLILPCVILLEPLDSLYKSPRYAADNGKLSTICNGECIPLPQNKTAIHQVLDKWINIDVPSIIEASNMSNQTMQNISNSSIDQFIELDVHTTYELARLSIKLMALYDNIMDVYLISLLFNRKQRNIVIYVGDRHAQRYREFFQYLNY